MYLKQSIFVFLCLSLVYTMDSSELEDLTQHINDKISGVMKILHLRTLGMVCRVYSFKEYIYFFLCNLLPYLREGISVGKLTHWLACAKCHSSNCDKHYSKTQHLI